MSQSAIEVKSVTLSGEALVEGVGLFTGAKSRMVVGPAPAGMGIAFRRRDLGVGEREVLIPAHVACVVSEQRRTVLAADTAQARANPKDLAKLPCVQTVEHILSALVGLGITDALVDVEGPEIPIGDGSALPFVEAVLGMGVREVGGSGGCGEPLVMGSVVRVEGPGWWAEARPPEARQPAGCRYEYHLDYSSYPVPQLAAVAQRRIPAQEAAIEVPVTGSAESRDRYAEEVAPARTFCLVEEAQMLRQQGLFGHVTPREMLVIGDAGPMENAWRFASAGGSDEPARHKLLDLIGDLALVGRPLVGRIVAHRTGHAQNQELARRLLGL